MIQRTPDPTPLYAQLEAQIAAGIANGDFPVGTRLPTEDDLIKRFKKMEGYDPVVLTTGSDEHSRNVLAVAVDGREGRARALGREPRRGELQNHAVGLGLGPPDLSSR